MDAALKVASRSNREMMARLTAVVYFRFISICIILKFLPLLGSSPHISSRRSFSLMMVSTSFIFAGFCVRGQLKL